MNFRRQPFQFTTIDPAKRQAELQKRFGLPSDEMYVDCVNPGIMGAGSREPATIGGSPRLQHRVPIFTPGFDQTKPERCQNVDTEHKPRIRTIPIEIEGADGTTKRHRTFSGPASSFNDFNCESSMPSPFSGRKLSNISNTNGETSARPKVCNIPIQVETNKEKRKIIRSAESTNANKDEMSVPVKTNGCAASKPSAEVSPEPADEKPPEPDTSVPLKQIENVLLKLKTYHEEVEKFSGTIKDKQYRYLDEMLTRCMLDLDNVDTLGLDNVRQSRKSAVKQVQASVDLLESKINAKANAVEDSAVLNNSDINTDIEMKETTEKTVQDNSISEIGNSTVEASEPVSQAMETSDTEEVIPVAKVEPVVDESADDSMTVTTVGDGDNVNTESDLVKNINESTIEFEKPENSVIVEEISDTSNLKMEESNKAESIPVAEIVQEPVIEMEVSSDSQSETVLEPVVEMEALDIQIDETVQNTEPVLEPLVTEPVDSNESSNLPNDSRTVTDVKELEEHIVENHDIVVTEISEEPSISVDSSSTPLVEETNTVQTVSENIDSSNSS